MVMEQRFFLIRHGESLGNIGLDSSVDPTLSPTGHIQVEKCARLINNICKQSGVIYTSPLERCIVTAEAIHKITGMAVKLEPDLHEYFSHNMRFAKDIKLTTISEKKKKHDFLILPDEYEDKWWPKSNETPSDLELRISMFRNRLLREERNTNNIICIGHWCSIKALAESFISDIDFKYVGNATVTCIVRKEDASFSMDFINQTFQQ
jgi:broad specificity phosphatase PhoE